MTLVAIGVSHKTAPVALRERVELTNEGAAGLLESLVREGAASEAVALSTCNRTELYLAAEDLDAAERAALAALAASAGLRTAQLSAATASRRGVDVARHLFRVTAGLESMIPGEAEIQGQVRRSYEQALSLGTSGRVTNRLLQGALRAGKRARGETGLCRNPASVASVAVELARGQLGDLAGRRAVVIGAGKHGTLTARALADAGVKTIFVASRAWERAEDLARRFGGRAVRFESMRDELARADLLLTCTSCPQRLVSAADLAAAASGRAIVVVDAAVPRDVEPAARALPGVTLYDMDDIQRATQWGLAGRAREAERAAPIVEEEVERFARWLCSLEVVPTISALRTRGLAAAERAVRENEGRWHSLTDEDRRRVDLMVRAVVSDLLHEPTLRLRRAGERGSSTAYAEMVRELFGLSA
jgi:glutamyl-tRNA reductase